MRRMQKLLLAVMLPAAAALCLQFSLLDPAGKAVGMALAMAAFWVGLCRLHPAGVGLILGICLFVSRVNFPPLSLGILTAAAAGGAVGARLTQAEAEEDDFFFLPLLTIAGLLIVMIAAGLGGGWHEVLRKGNLALEPFRQAMTDLLAQQPKEVSAGWAGQFMLANLNLCGVISLSVMGSFGFWLMGRLARRLLGRLKGVRQSLIMFQIHQRYIFLLIIGLILEILCSLALREGFAFLAPWRGVMRFIAGPILGVVALAAFLEGLGIILFLAAIRRMAGQAEIAFWLTVAGVVVALLFFHFVIILGLADVWLDLRKLERLRRQLENAAPNQKD